MPSRSASPFKLIHVNRDKCNNCHHCISICPVKACIDGSGYRIDIIHERCLGCGRCVAVCHRKARALVDDSERFFAALESAAPVIAIVAPSAVTVFPDILKLNGFLRSLGVLAVFDVSFGAELTAKSYLRHIKTRNPPVLIAQPCAALVSFCQIYHPELLPHLAPVHSPMLHTAIMIRRFFPQYDKAEIAALSPCAAKKREFEETGYIAYNVLMTSVKRYMEDKMLGLDGYPPVPFAGPHPERAVGFSSPGGLRTTVLRDAPDLAHRVRRIEGGMGVYNYLTEIPQMLLEKNTPLIVDCLSCVAGCNGGLGTGNTGMPIDRLEAKVEKRMIEHIRRHKAEEGEAAGRARIRGLVETYWEEGLYRRAYRNLHGLLDGYHAPDERQLGEIYKSMKKRRESDFLNCAACGYGSCKSMAEAIFNKLNRAENCHQYLSVELEIRGRLLHDTFGRYLSDELVDSLIDSPQALALGGKMRLVTILMSDLRGFTSLTERLNAGKVVPLLNHYFSAMVEIIHSYKGTVIEYMGDSILAIFGAPVEIPSHADNAIACAVKMQNRMESVNEWNRENGFPALTMGIGINTGESIVGNIGSERRMKYNVIGKHVNLAARVEGYTTGGQIYVSDYARRAARASLSLGNAVSVNPKGIAGSVDIFPVEGIGSPYNLRKKALKLPLRMLKAPIPCAYFRIDEKHVRATPAPCALLAYSPAEAVIGVAGPEAPPRLLDNIKLRPPASLSAGLLEPAPDIFAKVTARIKQRCFRVAFTSDAQSLCDALESAPA